jgi:hypothetical protein
MLAPPHRGAFFYAAPQTTGTPGNNRHCQLDRSTDWNSGSNAMPSGSAHEFEQFARDCVRLAEQADTPVLREKLLNLAREWMRAVMDEEDIVMSRQAAE